MCKAMEVMGSKRHLNVQGVKGLGGKGAKGRVSVACWQLIRPIKSQSKPEVNKEIQNRALTTCFNLRGK